MFCRTEKFFLEKIFSKHIVHNESIHCPLGYVLKRVSRLDTDGFVKYKLQLSISKCALFDSQLKYICR